MHVTFVPAGEFTLEFDCFRVEVLGRREIGPNVPDRLSGSGRVSAPPIHRGVNAVDPRNAAPIDLFRPKKIDAPPLRETLSKVFSGADLERKIAEYEALIAKAGEGRRSRPEARRSSGPVLRTGTHPDIIDIMEVGQEPALLVPLCILGQTGAGASRDGNRLLRRLRHDRLLSCAFLRTCSPPRRRSSPMSPTGSAARI